jgi:hypothetical protein
MAARNVPPDNTSAQTTMSPEAVALLEFTSDTSSQRGIGDLAYITSKGAYIWGGVAVFIARSAQPSRVEDIAIHSAIYSAMARDDVFPSDKKTDESSLLPFMKVESRIHDVTSLKYDVTNIQYRHYDRECVAIISAILRNLGLGVSDRTCAEQINSYIKLRYEEVLSQSLIIDPIIETTLGLGILSLLPFSFVKRTKKGQLEYRKIQAAVWKYEWSRKRGDVQTNLTFEAARIAKALKVGIIAAYHEATSSEGDEPEDPLPGPSST